nr:carbohydrate kinase [Isoptericola jiangsuensis]
MLERAPQEPEDGHVLVVGEALIDQVHRADATVDQHPGGSLANVALTLGRLERDVRLATWIADDDHGEVIRNWLRGAGVALVPGSTAAAATSVATAHLDEHGAATYDFDLEWRVPRATRAEGALAVHTGSIAALIEPGATQVRQLLISARADATLTYDPNVRPALMGDPADARTRVEELIALADVVKVSDEDIAWLAPGVEPAEIASAWLALGPALVVVTLGGEEALAVSSNGQQRVAAPPTTVVDTVGAGDSFMGALLDGLWQAGLLGGDRRDALRGIDDGALVALLERCVAVAAVTVSRAGANPPHRTELTRRVGPRRCAD